MTTRPGSVSTARRRCGAVRVGLAVGAFMTSPPKQFSADDNRPPACRRNSDAVRIVVSQAGQRCERLARLGRDRDSVRLQAEGGAKSCGATVDGPDRWD